MSSNSALPKDMVLCRWCKKPIMAKDKICKYCDSCQNDLDIRRFDRELLKDSTLSEIDWVCILFFQIIGFGLGAIHIGNGENKRGFKVIVYSILILFINLTMLITSRSVFIYFKKLISMN